MTAYEDAVDYLLSFADFERSGRFQSRPDVAPMRALLSALGDPHLGRRTVHITGSKGKGSTAAMIESIHRASGLHSGLYTSPHLHSYTERIRIDGTPVPRNQFSSLVDAVRAAVERVQPALGDRQFVTFDLLTAMGFLAFRDAAVDVQIIEVGLGGRVDSTNVFDSKEVAVITPISLEHTEVLGDTVEEIAAEKAGIITAGSNVVLATQAASAAADVVESAARRVGAEVIRADSVPLSTVETTALAGAHQLDNARTAVAAVRALRPDITEGAIREGLAAVSWPARAEVINDHPLVIADGAHNRDSARALATTLREHFGATSVTFIIGSSVGKDIEGLAAELAPIADRVFNVRSNHPRAMDPAMISAAFRALNVPAEDVDTVGAAIERAIASSGKGGVICLTGSLFVAAEGREHFGLADGGDNDGDERH